jgi:pyroglutamyl-peptidase
VQLWGKTARLRGLLKETCDLQMQRLVDKTTHPRRPASRAATLLLTGFGPFPGVPANPSKRLIARLAEIARRRWPKLHVVTLVLPTEWVRAPLLVEAMLDRWQPDVAVHFGVSGQASGFDIECRALNKARPMRDASGRLPAAPHLDPSGGRHLHATAEAARLIGPLRRAGHVCRLSTDAGGYLCNAVYYHSLRHAQRHAPDRVVAFVHVPRRLRAELRLQGAIRVVDAAMAAGGLLLARRLR